MKGSVRKPGCLGLLFILIRLQIAAQCGVNSPYMGLMRFVKEPKFGPWFEPWPIKKVSFVHIGTNLMQL